MTDDDKHRALDPAIAERVQALTRRLRKTEEAGRVHHLSKADRLASADLITALLAQLAALRAERDALAAQVAEVTSDRAYIIGANDGWEAAVEQDVATPAAAAMLARAEAAEAKVEKLVEAAEGLSAILDKNETKGPLPDTVLMFCWLAAQNVRAVLRGYMLEKPE